MTIEMVTSYGEAVVLSLVLEPVRERAVPQGPVLVQRLRVPAERLLRRPPGLNVLGVLDLLGYRRHGKQSALARPLRLASMGQVASAPDNAATESWHALLQKNVLNRRRWRTRDELHHSIMFWIEHTCNRRH